jgi:hypothetical protein
MNTQIIYFQEEINLYFKLGMILSQFNFNEMKTTSFGFLMVPAANSICAWKLKFVKTK